MNVVGHQNIFSRVNTFSEGSSQDMDMMTWQSNLNNLYILSDISEMNTLSEVERKR